MLALTTMQDLFTWYMRNLVEVEIYDPRGHRVRFLDTDFVHLIKMVTKYGEEPKNARMTIDQIEKGRIQLVANRFDTQRAQELCWARSIASDPWHIVANLATTRQSESWRSIYSQLRHR